MNNSFALHGKSVETETKYARAIRKSTMDSFGFNEYMFRIQNSQMNIMDIEDIIDSVTVNV